MFKYNKPNIFLKVQVKVPLTTNSDFLPFISAYQPIICMVVREKKG